MAEYDQLTRDLAHKAGDDASAAIYRTVLLHDDPASRTMIAMMAAGQAFAIVVSLMAERLDGVVDPAEAITDALWEKMRPIVLDTARARIAGRG